MCIFVTKIRRKSPRNENKEEEEKNSRGFEDTTHGFADGKVPWADVTAMMTQHRPIVVTPEGHKAGHDVDIVPKSCGFWGRDGLRTWLHGFR